MDTNNKINYWGHLGCLMTTAASYGLPLSRAPLPLRGSCGPLGDLLVPSCTLCPHLASVETIAVQVPCAHLVCLLCLL